MTLRRLAELRIDSDPCCLRLVRALVHGAMEALEADPEVTECVVLAVNEACANVIRHAYGPERSGEIVLEILNNQDQIKFRLSDYAPPVDRSCVCPREQGELRPGGLGMHLIRKIMDQAEFVEPPPGVGNVFEMTKRGLKTRNAGEC